MKYKTENEILADAVRHAQSNGLLGLDEGLVQSILAGEEIETQYVLDLSTHAYINADFEERLEEVDESFDIATARGVQLDDFGKFVNVHRFSGQAATLVVNLSLEVAANNDIVIPGGTRVLIDPTQVPSYVEYTTDNDFTVKAGVTTANIPCSSNMEALQPRIPAGCVYGLEGFSQFVVDNIEEGTRGRNLESDDEYRQRVLLWSVINTRGTRQAFEDYLGSVEGLDDYCLIPRPEGVGTLTVVCDCLDSEIDRIRQGIQDNCMIYTDKPVETVGVAHEPLDITINAVSVDDPSPYTLSEIVEMVRHEVMVFIDGGVTRTGSIIQGLRIGENFTPSRLVMHIHNMFPELTSVTCSNVASDITGYERVISGDVVVVIE